jgi:UDP-glucose 4-epimerase
MIAETLLAEYHAAFAVPSCAARVFSAYGPGLNRQILWDVCRKAVAAPVVSLSGTGHETRDFIHVADVARAVRVLAENADMHGEAYNVASGVETTIASLAERLVAQASPEAVVEFSGVQRAGDPLRWCADISAIEELGFVPAVSLDEGIVEFARWCVGEAS